MTTAPSIQREVQKQIDALLEGDTEIITLDSLEEKLSRSLAEGRPLRVKQGIDPTTPEVHIGHMVPFRKMRILQEAGHLGILIIGDFTAQIGDPTDRDAERTKLDHQTTTKNAATYCRQIFNIVNEGRTEVHRQSAWFSDYGLEEVLELAAEFSVAHLLTHETFRKRLSPGSRLSLHELLYPTLQAFDSVRVNADIELGGSDQKFNILCGRDLMKARGMEPQVAVLTPLLPGTDGRKMSKSFGNCVSVESGAEEKIGILMSISDDQMPVYMALGAGMCAGEITGIMSALSSGEAHPREVKMDLAKRISRQFHSKEEVDRAAAAWEHVFSNRNPPEEMDSVKLGPEGMGIIALMTGNGLAETTSEARRLVAQGGVKLDGEKIGDVYFHIPPGSGEPRILKVGKRRFLRIE